MTADELQLMRRSIISTRIVHQTFACIFMLGKLMFNILEQEEEDHGAHICTNAYKNSSGFFLLTMSSILSSE